MNTLNTLIITQTYTLMDSGGIFFVLVPLFFLVPVLRHSPHVCLPFNQISYQR